MDGTKGIGLLGPKRWLGIGARILATLFFLLLILILNRCDRPNPPAESILTMTPTAGTANARLRVEVRPEGAHVYVDGLRSGTTLVSLDLQAGQHVVRVEMEGHEPLVQTVDLSADDEAIVIGELVPKPVSARVPSPAPVTVPKADPNEPRPDLAVRSIKVELERGGACDYTSTQLGVAVVVENIGNSDAGSFVVDVNGTRQTVGTGLPPKETVSLWFEGYGQDGENWVIIDTTFQVDESRKDNNMISQRLPVPTLPPPCTPSPTEPSSGLPTPPAVVAVTPSSPPPSPLPATVRVYEERIGITTYPYAKYVTEAWNQAFNMPYSVLDWAAYEASNPSPVEMTYRGIVLENEYLQLTFLPDLGGRLYEVYFKPTGHRETYRNPVLKPSPWGPPEQGWWLAAGGLEWCLPVEEHGYEWGTPWTAQVRQDTKGATIILRDTLVDDRVRTEVAVRLETGVGYFTIRPRLENPTGVPLPVKYWTNAMLAPGGQNAPSAELRFVLPDTTTAVTVHSRGDPSLPGYNEQMSWPVYNGLDMSRLGNWNRWLGFFQDPAVDGFMAVYDEGYDEGMVRVLPHDAEAVRGAKGFGFGWHAPIPTSNWTDDGSSYVEIHSGPAPSFDDSVTLAAGGHLQWTETWYPVAGLGRLNFANDAVALGLKANDGRAEIAVTTNQPWQGELILLLDGQERWREAVSLAPGRPFRDSAILGDDSPQSGQLMLRVEGPDGGLVAEYGTNYRLGSG